MLAFSKTLRLLIVLYFIQLSSALYFYINETETKCFIEEIPDETKVVVNCNVELYDPINGEFMPSMERNVHVEVRAPQRAIILSKAYSPGHIFFTSQYPGEHVICLSFNGIKWLNGSMLRVHLDIKVGPATINYATVALRERLSPLELRVKKLLYLAEKIRKEQNFQIYREYSFRELSESVQQWMLIWCILQSCLLLIIMGLWNFQHLKDIFKAKKLISLKTVEENKSRLSSHEDLAIVSFMHNCSTKEEDYTECASCEEKYCDQKCCEDVWKQYHGIHCLKTCILNPGQLINLLNEIWEQVHFPPEATSIVLAARIMASVCQPEDPSRTVSVSLQFYHKEVNEEGQSAYKLLSEQFVGELKVPQELIPTVCSDDVQQRLTLEGLHVFFGLVANNGDDTKLFNNWIKKLSELQMPNNKKQELDAFIKELSKATDKAKNNIHISENSASLPLLNICEDNLELNCTNTSPDNSFLLSMCSVRDVDTNEEILIIYQGRNALERSQHGRQTLLRGKYLLTCYCYKCVKPEDDHTTIRNDADESHCEDN